jgi:microcin C transport system substrate-binding protein
MNITILHYDNSDLRHLNIYLEDLKKVGITAHIEIVSESTFTKRVDNHEFYMIWANWEASRLEDPESMWSSKFADDIATQNYCGLKDPEVDKLIEAQKTEMDISKRNDILRKIDARLVELNPYVLLWQSASHRLLYWNRFGMPKSVLSKYGNESDSITYWWYDKAKSDALDDAMKRDVALPAQPAEVHYGQ